MGCCCSSQNANEGGDFSLVDDELLYVEIYHRHGDRTPAYLLLSESIESSIWIPMIADHYKWLQYNSLNNKIEYLENKDEVFSWNFINKQLKFTQIINTDNDNKDNDEYTVEQVRNSDIKWKYLLTNTGVSQLNETGKYLRNRYINELNFLPNNLNENINNFNNNIYYESTNDTRNIFSADSVLQELIGANINHDEKIPIYINPQHNYYFNPFNTTSRSAEYKISLNKSSEFVLKNDLLPKIEELKNEILLKFNNGDNINDNKIEYYQTEDAYTCRNDHILSNNPVIKKEKEDNVIDSKLAKSFQQLQYKHAMYQIGKNIKYGIGNQLYSLYNNLNNNNTPKCRIYSCHDSTLMAFLCALNKNEDAINLTDIYEWPRYGVPMCFEVWLKEDGTKYVQVMYNNKQIKINGENEITIQELQEFWNDIMIST